MSDSEQNSELESADLSAGNPETQMNLAESSISDIVDKAQGLSQSLQEASAKLEETSRAVDSAEQQLNTVQETVSQVTGVQEEDSEKEEEEETEEGNSDESEIAASENPAPAATPVADAVAASQAAAAAGGDSTAYIEEDVVYECTYEERVVSGKYAVDDFNFTTSTTDLLSSVDGGSGGTMRIYEYPAKHLDASGGEAVANIRIAEEESYQKALRGASFCKAFIAGFKFELDQHDRTTLNGKYVLHAVKIDATDKYYDNRFVALPEATTFRPPRKTKRTKIYGTQTAIVVGPEGEEIWTDEYGRVKVKFHWDQTEPLDDTVSCWVRVMQGWAGKTWGMMFIPRIGMEVIVTFLEGDPDRPLITGMVYNAQQTVPYALPDNQTRSTIKTNTSKKDNEGDVAYNEIRFEDKKDEEEIFVHAQKDMNLRVENDLVEIVKTDFVQVVRNNRQLFVQKPDSASEDMVDQEAKPELDGEAIDTLVVEGGNKKTTVKGDDKTESRINEGFYEHEVGKTFTLTVKGDTITIEATGADGSGDIVIKGKTISLESTSGDVTIKSAANFKNEAAQKMENKSGTEFKNEAGTSMANKSGTDFKNEAGTALTNKSGTDFKNEAGTNMTNKANINMNNEASAMLTSKASGMHTVEAGGIMTVKGSLVKIN